jgi:Domain of unknown function (DUF4440)
MPRPLTLVLLLSLTAFAQTATTNKASRPEDEIVQLTQRWLAAGHYADTDVLDKIESEGFIATTPGGAVVTKNELMPTPENPSRLPDFSMRATTVRVDGDTAILMAQLVKQGGGPQLNVTNVFVRRNGKWQMIAAHLSPQSGG